MNTILATIDLAPVTSELSQAALALVGGAAIAFAAVIPVVGVIFGATALYDWFRELAGHGEEDDIAAMKKDHEEMEKLGL